MGHPSSRMTHVTAFFIKISLHVFLCYWEFYETTVHCLLLITFILNFIFTQVRMAVDADTTHIRSFEYIIYIRAFLLKWNLKP
jgi:hypothetical protein